MKLEELDEIKACHKLMNGNIGKRRVDMLLAYIAKLLDSKSIHTDIEYQKTRNR